MRTAAGVMLGYLLFAIPAFLLFAITHHDPHAPATVSFEIGAIAYGALFALLGGYAGTVIAGRSDMMVGNIIAAFIVVIAVASMIAVGIGWSPLSAIVFNAPAAILGGYLRVKKRATK